MSKYSIIFDDHGVTMRPFGDVANCTPAWDVFVEDADGKLAIKNPAERVLQPWDAHFDVKTGYKYNNT
jgi:hypothetical protein